MASTGVYVAVAAGCSVVGFATGVAGDLLRQKLLVKGKVVARHVQEGVPDIESNLQASFLEQPATEEETRARAGSSLRFSVAASEKEVPEGSVISTRASAEDVSHSIADALPYGAAEDETLSPSAILAEALPYGAACSFEDEFVPDLSKCLPGCLDPVQGLHHAKCPNHESCHASKRAGGKAMAQQAAEASEEPMSLADRIRQTGAVPYCQSFERKALPYGPPTLGDVDTA